MRTTARMGAAAVATVAALGLLAACGDDEASAGSDGGSGLTITTPDDGATVGTTFDVTWDSDVELGEPDTGRDHVHVFVDGHSNDYTVVGGNEFTLEDLSPGEHTVNITLQHADHSSAGQEDEISVTVDEDGATTPPDDEQDEEETEDPGLGY